MKNNVSKINVIFEVNKLPYYYYLLWKNDYFFFLVYKYPLEMRNVNFDLKIGETTNSTSEGQSKNIDAMLWWTIQHKQEIFKNNQ